jgi:hypothetical protein
MRIRIKCRDEWLDWQQVVEGARFIMPSARRSKVSHKGGNEGLRILCGSISSLLV